jgi:hypothetical protein
MIEFIFYYTHISIILDTIQTLSVYLAPNLTPTGLIMQRVRTSRSIIGAADACVHVGYFQLFSVRFQVNCSAPEIFPMRYLSYIPDPGYACWAFCLC